MTVASSSQTAGVLRPTASSDSVSQTFENTIHDWLVDVSGLTAKKVRPQWQSVMQPIADYTDMIIFGFTFQLDSGSVEKVEAEQTVVTYFGGLVLNLIFYGDSCREYAQTVLDSCTVEQSLEALGVHGLGYRDGQINTQFLEPNGDHPRRRCDAVINFNYTHTRTFAIKTLTSAKVTQESDTGHTQTYTTDSTF